MEEILHYTSKLDRRQRILMAAEAVFAQEGYSGARVNQIAKKAGVNKALIYYYFDSKEKLLEEIVKANIKMALDIKNNLLKDLNISNKEEMEVVFDAVFRYLKCKKEIIRIINIEALKTGSSNPSIFDFLDPSIEDATNHLSGMSKKGHDPLSFFISVFFFGIMPISTFLVLGEKWAEHHGYDIEEADRKFTQIFKTIYLDSIVKYYSNTVS